MKFKIPTVIEKDVKYLSITAPVNYCEEEIPNDFPGRHADTWIAHIDVDTGIIAGWPSGKEAAMHLTVKDSGDYRLFTQEGELVAAIEGNYVPHGLVPGSYGDTIELQIAGDGRIKNWPRASSMNLSDFTPEN